MKRFRWAAHAALCAGVWALGMPLSAQAQAAQPVQAITLADVLRAARENAEARAAGQQLAAARADVLAADHAPAPQLTGKLSSIDLQNGIGNAGLSNKRVDSSLGIDWTWERGGKRRARTQAAERSVDAAQADLEATLVAQSIAAGGAFFDLLGAQQRVAETRALADSAGQMAGIATRRVRAGDLAEMEGARSQIDAQRSAADLRAAELDRERARIALVQLLSPALVSGQQLLAEWPPVQEPAVLDIDAVVAARPEVLAAQARVASAEAALAVAQAQQSADVTLGVSLDRYPGTSNRLLEVRATVPLQWGYRFEGEIGRAQAALAQSQDALDKARSDARLELARLREEAQAGAERLRRFEQQIVPGARRVAESAELAYRKGALSQTDLLDARRTLRATELDAIAARVDHAKAALAFRLRTSAPPQP